MHSLWIFLTQDVLQMMGLLAQLTNLTPQQIRNRIWRQAPLWWHRFVGAAIRVVVFPAIFLIGGSLLGGVAPRLKDLLVMFGTLLTIVPILYLFGRGAVLGVVIPALLHYKKPGTKPGPGDADALKALESAGKDYLKILAGVLASELVIGLLAWRIPAHRQPWLIAPLLIAALAYAMYAAWTGGVGFWKKVVRVVPGLVIVSILLAMAFPALPRVAEYGLEKVNDGISCLLPDANCPPVPSDRRAPAGPPPLPFNRKAPETKARPDGCTEVWMAGNEENGVSVGTLQPGQTARVRYLGGRITYNNRGEAWPHWGTDYYLSEWKTSLRYHNREGIMPHAIVGVLGELGSPAAVASFKRNANEFAIANSEPTTLPFFLYYHDGLQLYAQNGWEGSRAKLEVCILSTTARLNGTP